MCVVSNCKRANFPANRLERCIFPWIYIMCSLAFPLFHGVFYIQYMFHRSHKFNRIGKPDSVKVLVTFLRHNCSRKSYPTTVFLDVNVTFFVCPQQTTEPRLKFSEIIYYKQDQNRLSFFIFNLLLLRYFTAKDSIKKTITYKRSFNVS